MGDPAPALLNDVSESVNQATSEHFVRSLARSLACWFTRSSASLAVWCVEHARLSRLMDPAVCRCSADLPLAALRPARARAPSNAASPAGHAEKGPGVRTLAVLVVKFFLFFDLPLRTTACAARTCTPVGAMPAGAREQTRGAGRWARALVQWWVECKCEEH